MSRPRLSAGHQEVKRLWYWQHDNEDLWWAGGEGGWEAPKPPGVVALGPLPTQGLRRSEGSLRIVTTAEAG